MVRRMKVPVKKLASKIMLLHITTTYILYNIYIRSRLSGNTANFEQQILASQAYFQPRRTQT